ncbi:MAG: adenylate cyclase [Phycisphaerales bacterium]|nr:adenylate cyclase [Phycisphaerales bacterium]
MRLPVRLPEYRLYQKWLAATIIAVVCAGLGVVLWTPARILGAVGMLDHVFYDSLFRLRPAESQMDSQIIIIAANDKSIATMQQERRIGWPWPRTYWGKMISYLDNEAKAKAVVFDLLFDGSSARNAPEKEDDDELFAGAIDASETPVILASRALPDHTVLKIAPPVRNPILGASNISAEGVIRTYTPVVDGLDSIALRTMKQIKQTPPSWATSDQPYLLRFYGPHSRGPGAPVTFRYIEAAKFLEVADNPDADPAMAALLKDKIVFIATITAGTYDLKASPLQSQYPGVELHATALQNMLANQRVTPIGFPTRVLTLMFACFIAAIGTVIPARVPLKLVGGVSGLAMVLAITAAFFLSANVRWMPPAAALFAAMLSAFVGLSYSYLTELRQRRFILKAFAQSVSKEVADEIAKDPKKLGLGGQRRDMTVMFTDLANFTTLSEALEVEKLAAVLQFYLEEMSGVVLGVNGTLDKYIGDAIMAFWNAPVNQPDHAFRACRGALEMRRREAILQPKILEMAGTEVYSRIGINSGPMVVGNLGSTFKFAYTVIGDAVNLGSRLEGANKMYGTRIMLSETTAAIVKDQFILRKLDLLRVKGKFKPMAVYELIGERTAASQPSAHIARYEQALALYQAGQFDQALELLTILNKDFPDDGPTVTLLARVIKLREHPPGPEWDGVYVAKDK